MPDRHLEPGELQAWLDGEAAPQEHARLEAHLRSCQVCREAVSRAAWEVGLILTAGPDEGAAAPSPDFTDRVLERIRATPRGVEPPLRALPPVPRPAPLSRRLRFAAAAAAVLAAASVGLWFAGGTGRSPDAMPTGGQGGAVVEARRGGVLRWTGRSFDRSLAGSAWVATDAAVPTSAGEILHSPAPSSIRVRLPGGGWLDAGPSSWLSYGGDGGFALLEGALTASADPSGRLVVEVPGVVVTVTGEVEVSARTPSGARSAEGARWLGAWAAARTEGAAPGTPPTPAPAAALVIYARRGPVEVAGSPGPVRNSLEKATIPEGQALVVLEKKVYRVATALEEAMPEETGWLAGMPVPPDSKFFRAGATAPGPAPAPPPHLGTGGGPVRNSLERALADRDREAEARAYALSIYDSVGGVEAVAAAAGAVDDPAVLVRSAAVRILALNAWADRERAFAALRILAKDPDAGVARFAILAIKVLGDRGAIPILKALVVDDDAPPDSPAVVDDDAPPDSPAVVDDDAPPDSPAVTPDGRQYRGPREVARVYAFDALVYFGDTSTLAQAAALVPRVAGDRTLAGALHNAIKNAVKRLDHAEIRGLLASEISGMRAAAIRALGDASEARKALKDPSESIRLATLEVLLVGPGAEGFGEWEIQVDGSLPYRLELARLVGHHVASRPGVTVPDWAVRLCRSLLESPHSPIETASNCARVLQAADELSPLLSKADDLTDVQLAAIITATPASLDLVRRGLRSELPHVRLAALQRLSTLPLRPESEATTTALLEICRDFTPAGDQELTAVMQTLSMLAKCRSSQAAIDALLLARKSPNSIARRNAFFMLLGHLERPEICEVAVAGLRDPDERIATAAARSILYTAHDSSRQWAGPPLGTVIAERSSHTRAEGLLALAAWRLEIQGAEDRALDALARADSAERFELLSNLTLVSLHLTRPVPTLMEDPSPRVRLQYLHALRDSARSVVASRLVDDPFAWVRGTALAYLAVAGDSNAEFTLRELMRAGFGTAVGEPGPISFVSPERADVATAFLGMSKFVAPLQASLAPAVSPGVSLGTEIAATLHRGVARRSASFIAGDQHPIQKIQLLRSLRQSGGALALGVLIEHSDRAIERDASVREVALHAALESIGFCPREGVKTFYSSHAEGLLSAADLSAISGSF